MAKSHFNAQEILQEEEEYTLMEDSDDVDSDDSDQDPTYTYDLDIPQLKLSKLSIKNHANHRDDEITEVNDEEVLAMEERSAPKLSIKDLKSFEEIQKIIDCGQVEKLKLEQCKVYLRKYGLRLTGNKDVLVQRIKEHLEILNGGGERKYPPSSFVLNCKGDACMRDIVMFEQTVYEGYNIASRSAIGPPCGKRTVVGRIVKESYGAAKQQHTFTVEVLWSKGDKPLPPLHPLLIKGRNLYKSTTLRQRWEDESERQRVLNEKHSRGSLARSNREARIQEKKLKKDSKGIRSFAKKEHNSHQEKKNHEHSTNHIPTHCLEHLGTIKTQNQHIEINKTQTQQPKQSHPNIPIFSEFKEHPYPRLPLSHSSHHNIPKMAPPTSLSNFPPLQPNRLSHYEHSRQYNREYKDYEHSRRYNQEYNDYYIHRGHTSTYNFMNQNLRTYNIENQFFSSDRTSFRSFNGGNNRKEEQQPCKYYPRGRCHYGDQCRFLHE